ncbi:MULTISPECIES: ABC transporter permease [unclassified Pseudomonas]|uniref:ABC transporter permease n=1 Tax=unclassified Pseudomonas TaxID=196821 RepID=UPI00088F7B56|nr:MULTISPECIES: ABC transporter permease [unclassified Pseudomonas]SCY01284.1 NitT/TauT family transport system permease protein [Pseudomonas sp. NFACC37-1]SFO12238.1 NitT/TauT family transport system permease protein [Pseudomonas sp. NFACC24-1]
MNIFLGRLAIFAGIFLSWQFASGPLVDPFFVSSPLEIGRRFIDLVASGRLFAHGWITVVETLVGFFFGALAGITVGLILGRNALLAKLLDPILTSIYSLPKVALAPLFIMWFGIGIEMKIILTATIVFFLVFLNTYSGVRAVEREQLEILRLMGAKEHHLITKVVLPSAIQWVFTGLKLSVPYALIGAIVGEIMAANRGLGYLLQDAAGQLDTAGVFAALIAIIALALLLQAAVRALETYLMPWKKEQDEREISV